MASNPNYCDITPEIEALAAQSLQNSSIDAGDYVRYDVKRGLRDLNGKGVLAGLTEISDIIAKKMVDGQEIPCDGKLYYRGIDVEKLVAGALKEGRFGFEETAYLLLLGRLPNVMRQCLQLIALFPVLSVYGYQAYTYKSGNSLYIHAPQPELSTAENILSLLRPDSSYSFWEAHVLDICLTLHAEHGGGNNSAFACRVLSSSGTDIYSSIAAAVGSLKGPRHGGANKKVMEMFGHIEAEVSDWTDDDAVRDYLGRLLRKEAGDRSGLIYGMGHAIYTLSDPRAVLLKRFARSLAETKGMLDEFELFERVERLTPEVLRTVKGEEKVVCANVDLFSGLVYKMMGIPMELYTPLFAVARMVGWCAHRIEEVCQPANRIIRPAYKAVAPMRAFVPLDQR